MGKIRYKHTHKYRRAKYGKAGYEVYKCDVPGCPHFVDPGILIGRNSICHTCGQEFTIDKMAADLAKPVCRVCLMERRQESLPPSEQVSHQAVADLINSLLNDDADTK